MAVTQLGAVPVFVDVHPEDFTMDVEDALAKRSTRCRALIAVHLYGMPSRLKNFSMLGLPIIEDAAQALQDDAATGDGAAFGVAAAFSFAADKKPRDVWRRRHDHVSAPAHRRTRSAPPKLRRARKYSSEVLGSNSRLDELHAAILRVKLPKPSSGMRGAGKSPRHTGRRSKSCRWVCRKKPAGVTTICLWSPRRSAMPYGVTCRRPRIPTLVHYPIPLPEQPATAVPPHDVRRRNCARRC